jgi:hypothetical protein
VGGDIILLVSDKTQSQKFKLRTLSPYVVFNKTWSPKVKLVVHITRKFGSPKLCGSYAPLNLKISPNILLKQLVSATPLKLLNRISWNLVGSKDTICSCAYYLEILISWILWEFQRSCADKLVWRTDGQDKNNMSPHQSGGRHNNKMVIRSNSNGQKKKDKKDKTLHRKLKIEQNKPH